MYSNSTRQSTKWALCLALIWSTASVTQLVRHRLTDDHERRVNVDVHVNENHRLSTMMYLGEDASTSTVINKPTMVSTSSGTLAAKNIPVPTAKAPIPPSSPPPQKPKTGREKAGRRRSSTDTSSNAVDDPSLAMMNLTDIYFQSPNDDNLWNTSTLLPDWLKDYFQWHQQVRSRMNATNWRDFRFIVCVAKKGIKSGGMTDRLRPLPLLLRLAAQTNRVLLVHWSRPFPLEEFLQPPRGGMDWRIPTYMQLPVNQTVGPQVPWELIERDARDPSPARTIVTIKYQSWHYGEQIYNQQLLQGEPSATTAFRDIWKVLFTPSPPVARRIRANFHQLQLIPGEYTTAHIRAFYGRTDRSTEKIDLLARNAMNCASQLRPGGPFFVASDSFRAIQTAIHYGQAHNVTVIAANHPGQPLHVDFHDEASPADFYDGFVDLYLMAGTRCAAVGPGGFARWGHLLGYANETCTIQHAGRKLQTCDWKSQLEEGESVPGYSSENERIQLQYKAHRDQNNAIPKYLEPMPFIKVE